MYNLNETKPDGHIDKFEKNKYYKDLFEHRQKAIHKRIGGRRNEKTIKLRKQTGKELGDAEDVRKGIQDYHEKVEIKRRANEENSKNIRVGGNRKVRRARLIVENEFPWMPPVQAQAEVAGNNKKLFGGRGKLCCSRIPKATISDAPSNMRWHFALHKCMAIALWIITALSIPSLVILSSGRRFSNTDMDGLTVGRVTLGNLGPKDGDEAGEFEDECFRQDSANCDFEIINLPASTSIPFSEASTLVSLLDAFSSFGFIFILLWFWYKVAQQKIIRSFPQPHASDYAVLVKHLPSDVNETELAQHFANLYDLSKPDWVSCGGIPPKLLRRPTVYEQNIKVILNSSTAVKYRRGRMGLSLRVEEGKHMGNPVYENTFVAHVATFADNAEIMRLSTKVQQLQHTIDTLKIYEEKYQENSPWADKQRWLEYHLDRLDVYEEIREITTRLGEEKHSSDTKVAVVMFNAEESVLRCLEDYEGTNSWLGWLFMPDALKLKRRLGADSKASGDEATADAKPAKMSKHRLTVTDITEPENIYWENIVDTSWKKSFLSLVSYVVGFLLVLCTALVISRTNSITTSFRSKDPGHAFCRWDLPATAFESYDFPRNTFLRRDTEQFNIDDSCPDGLQYFEYDGGTHDPCLSKCVDPNSPKTCATANFSTPVPRASGMEFYTAKEFIACFCVDELSFFIKDQGSTFGGASEAKRRNGDLCGGIIDDFTALQSSAFATGFFIVFVNILLEYVMKGTMEYERFDSSIQKTVTLTKRLIGFQLINTIVTTMAVNGQWPILKSILPDSLGLFTSGFDSFSPQWYLDVGSILVSAVISHIIFPPIIPAIHWYVVQPLRRKFSEDTAVTQDELEALFSPSEFPIASATAHLALFLTIPILFGGLIPILYVICACGLTVHYWWSKRNAMRILAPSINDATEKINSFLVKFFGVCLLLRFGINFWAFGDEDTISPTLVTNVRGTAAENMDRIQELKDEDSTGILLRINTAPATLHFAFLTFLILCFLATRCAGSLVTMLIRRCSCERLAYGKRNIFAKYPERFLACFSNYFEKRMMADQTVVLAGKHLKENFAIVDVQRTAKDALPDLKTVEALSTSGGLQQYYNDKEGDNDSDEEFESLVDDKKLTDMMMREKISRLGIVGRLLTKFWPNNAILDPSIHPHNGDRMYTWEVIAQKGATLYDLSLLPNYQDAADIIVAKMQGATRGSLVRAVTWEAGKFSVSMHSMPQAGETEAEQDEKVDQEVLMAKENRRALQESWIGKILGKEGIKQFQAMKRYVNDIKRGKKDNKSEQRILPSNRSTPSNRQVVTDDDGSQEIKELPPDTDIEYLI